MYTTRNLPNSPIYWEITDAEADMPMHFHSHVELIYSLEENVFINMFRIAHASRLLETSSGSITEIAMNAGFENIRTFNRAFKKVWGMTPTEFQENKQE